MKGFSITGFIVGIIAVAAGIAAIVFSCVGIQRVKEREF